MSANRFGERFQIVTFGESHGAALGVVIDGCPSGIAFDEALLQRELERRRPGGAYVSSRQEPDLPEILSGVYQGKTLGTPLALMVRNQDARSQDYQGLAPRAGHADEAWKLKFGHTDPRGGGRSSGRETVARVLGGAVARMVLADLAPQCRIVGFARSIGPFTVPEAEAHAHAAQADAFAARFPSPTQTEAVKKLLEEARHAGQSHGGVAELVVEGLPAGLGQPVFHKLKADLASALLGVGATSGIEIGAGFDAARTEGTAFHSPTEDAPPSAEPYGGIQGGISTGKTLKIRVSFKPTSSILDVARKGRHDPCIVPRAIPVLEAMVALVLCDHLLWARTDRSRNS